MKPGQESMLSESLRSDREQNESRRAVDFQMSTEAGTWYWRPKYDDGSVGQWVSTGIDGTNTAALLRKKLEIARDLGLPEDENLLASVRHAEDDARRRTGGF